MQVYRIYLPRIKAKLQEARAQYRNALWLMIEEVFLPSLLDFLPDSALCPTKQGEVSSLESKANPSMQNKAILPMACTSKALIHTCKYDKQKPQYKRTNYTIKTLKESFLKTGRLDAEYYQSKYDKNEAVVRVHKHARLKDLVRIKKSIEPGSEAYRSSGVPFVRVANLSKFGITQSEVFLEERAEFSALYPQKDEVLLSKDGSIGISYCMQENTKIILSGAILRLEILQEGEILPQFLSLVLNSITTKLQAQRDCGGSIIEHWRIEEIQNLLIPLLDFATQKSIESKITQSFALRKKAKELLDSAKKKVEREIEKTSFSLLQ